MVTASMELPQKPEGLIATYPEWLVMWALLYKMGKKIDFEFQSAQLGGRMTKGGAVLDFYLPAYGLAINVQGEYWHYQSSRDIAVNRIQRAALEGYGITVIYIDESDLMRNPVFYVSDALKGKDHSLMSR